MWTLDSMEKKNGKILLWHVEETKRILFSILFFFDRYFIYRLFVLYELNMNIQTTTNFDRERRS